MDSRDFESNYAYALFGEVRRQRALGNFSHISNEDSSFLDNLTNLKGSKLANALRQITQILHGCTGRMIVLLVDEHDTPLSSASNAEDYRKV